MLTALAAVVATLAVTGSALAQPAVVRVETRNFATQTGGTFVNRTAVTTSDPITYTDIVSGNTTTCDPTSPIAALQAAIGTDWAGTVDTNGNLIVTTIKGLAPPATAPQWTWMLWVDQHQIAPADACHTVVPAGSEVLYYPGCLDSSKTGLTSCFQGDPLYMRIRAGGPYDVDPQPVPGRGAPIVVNVIEDLAPSTNSTVVTDDGNEFKTNDPYHRGQANVAFTTFGPHVIMATEVDNSGVMKVPVRMPVCVTEGADGNCGSTFTPPPDTIDLPPSTCATNGHDGFCGTDDTSGPHVTISNISNKQVFKKKKGPGQVAGVIDPPDPNSTDKVQLKLTRTWTTRVKVRVKRTSKKKKSAKKASAAATKKKKKKKVRYRYRTVKHCQIWNDATALLETVKCGSKAAKGTFFESDLGDLRTDFSYHFAMTLPTGTYQLVVAAYDLNGFVDAPEVGRNILTFKVL